jgi:acyl-CoA dehydrogenase
MSTDFVALVRDLGPTLAARAAEHDASDSFVADNYADLKSGGFFAAGVPEELGGGGASHAELCAMLRELARYCSSTALALSMHTHQVAVPAWRWRHEGGVGEPLLRRVAAENLVLVTSGGSDWVQGSGRLEKVEGGYRLNARKVFASGSPAGDLFMTAGVVEDPADGPTVLHFPLSLHAEGVRILDNWRTLGMRGTGSNDVVIENAFVPDAAIGGRRPQGKWGIFHLVTMIALPIVYAVYVGIAEAARDLALESARRKRDDADVRLNVGEMENELRAARIALDSVIKLAAEAQPGPETSNEVMIHRTLIARAALASVEKAMEVAGGAGFFRAAGIERLFRDVQAARYHPLPLKRQLDFTGRFTLGLPID